MEGFVIFIVLAIGALLLKKYIDSKTRARNQRIAELLSIAERLQNVLNKIDKVKTTSSKVNNCTKALDLINNAFVYPEARKVIENIDELELRVAKIKDVLPIINHLEKSYRHRFKKKEKSELNCLLDALYEIKTNNINNEDFEIAKIYPENTEEMVTIEKITSRAKELGWESDPQEVSFFGATYDTEAEAPNNSWYRLSKWNQQNFFKMKSLHSKDWKIYMPEMPVAGVTHKNRTENFMLLAKKDDFRIFLKKEPDNPVDPNAIKVMGSATIDGELIEKQLGYVPKDNAEELKNEDELDASPACVFLPHEGRNYGLRIAVLIPSVQYRKKKS